MPHIISIYHEERRTGDVQSNRYWKSGARSPLQWKGRKALSMDGVRRSGIAQKMERNYKYWQSWNRGAAKKLPKVAKPLTKASGARLEVGLGDYSDEDSTGRGMVEGSRSEYQIDPLAETHGGCQRRIWRLLDYLRPILPSIRYRLSTS